MNSATNPPFIERARGCLLGLAVGDAVGTTLEFQSRDSFEPITDMVGGGPFCLAPGRWTDDTSMALCLAESLLEHRGFNATDVMERYTRWMEDGYLSSTGRCFDIGNTVREALLRFKETGEPFSGSEDPRSSGNGCLMRLAPLPILYAFEREQGLREAAASSRTTHGSAECVAATRLFCAQLIGLLQGEDREQALNLPADLYEDASPRVKAVARRQYLNKTRDEIRGTGYVVESWEASLWCFERAGDFREAVLLAANLGDDADTTAAITGQLAGAYWGERGIPAEWKEKLYQGDMIAGLAERLALLNT